MQAQVQIIKKKFECISTHMEQVFKTLGRVQGDVEGLKSLARHAINVEALFEEAQDAAEGLCSGGPSRHSGAKFEENGCCDQDGRWCDGEDAWFDGEVEGDTCSVIGALIEKVGPIQKELNEAVA